MKKFLSLLLIFVAMVTGKAMATDFVFAYDANAEKLSLTWPEGTVIELKNGGATLDNFSGYFNLQPGNPEESIFAINNQLVAMVALSQGQYTLHIPAGAYTVNGVAIEKIDHTFTVGNPVIGTTEELFKQKMWTVAPNPIRINGEGVTMTTIDATFMGSPLPVAYNTNEEGELNWRNNTKLVFTSKKNNITSIEIKGQAVEYASADKGTYKNGVWTGSLAEGESVTLTAGDGINVTSIKVNYNGGAAGSGGGDIVVPTIKIVSPADNAKMAQMKHGQELVRIKTNVTYSEVHVTLKNVQHPNSEILIIYHNGPIIGWNGTGENKVPIYANRIDPSDSYAINASVAEGTFPLYKDESYSLKVEGYVNPWDMKPSCSDEINIIGSGIEREKMSDAKLIKVTPDPSEKVSLNGFTVTLEFDKSISSVSAAHPMGFDGVEKLVSTVVPGSNNKIWRVTIPSQRLEDELTSVLYEVNITATDSQGLRVNLDSTDSRSDYALVLFYDMVPGGGNPQPTITLGEPLFSIAEGAEIEPTTKTINFKFPNATGVQGSYTLKVAGTIGDKDFHLTNVSGQGTMAAGADISVSLEDNKAYNMVIGTITIESANNIVFYSNQGNYQLNFFTKAGASENNFELGETTVSATEEAIKIEWSEADYSKLTGKDIAIHIMSVEVTANGNTYYSTPDDITELSGNVAVVIPYSTLLATQNISKAAFVPKAGDQITVKIHSGDLEVQDFTDNAFIPTILYTNHGDIEKTVTITNTTGINAIGLNDGGKAFNIAGQPAAKANGIVIKNGKKLVVR